MGACLGTNYRKQKDPNPFLSEIGLYAWNSSDVKYCEIHKQFFVTVLIHSYVGLISYPHGQNNCS